MKHYKEFTDRLKLLIQKNPQFITTALSNIFTMRLIGNKTHGDLAEIGIAEFINQFMYDYRAVHVGKDLYRAKEHEEDLQIINELTKAEFSLSLKAYGDGPLQLSTDKESAMFPFLEKMGKKITGQALKAIWQDKAFSEFGSLNVLPLIYDEKKNRCNIMVFDAAKAQRDMVAIKLVQKAEKKGRGRKHPVYRFYGKNEEYICEVRYGSTTANALQRGLWTHTKNALPYFDSITGGWIDYSHNLVLVKLFSHALVATQRGHEAALRELVADIERFKKEK